MIDMDAANAIESAIDAKIAKAASKETRTTGKVTRIDSDGTVFVMLQGSDIETPVKYAAAAVEPDEEVTVTISGGSMSIDGNYSRPATDDRTAKAAQLTADAAVQNAAIAADAAAAAVANAEIAEEAAISAQNSLKSVVQGATTVEKAVSVMQTALEAVVDYDPDNDEITEYFWHDANGAHVLGDTSGYRNDINSSGMDIVDVNTEDSVAQFGVSGARIGKETEGRIEISSNGLEVFTGSDSEVFQVLSNGSSHDIVTGYETTRTFRNVSASVDRNQGATGTTVSSTISSGTALASEEKFAVVSMTAQETVYLEDYGGWITRKFWSTPQGGAPFAIDNATSSPTYAEVFNGQGYYSGSIWLVYWLSSGVLNLRLETNLDASNANLRRFSFSISLEKLLKYKTMTIFDPAMKFGVQDPTYNPGSQSAILGTYTKASSENQVALGRYNVEDSNDTYAAIIGNGTADNARSNALAVKWDGTVESGIAGAGAVTWVNVLKGQAALYVPKDLTNSTTSNYAVGAVAMETAGGGAWTMANYNSEQLQFVYITPANKAAGTNTTNTPLRILSEGGIIIGGHSSEVGDIVETDISSNVSCAVSTYTNLGSIALTSGVWVITGGVDYASGAAGARLVSISTNSSGAPSALELRKCTEYVSLNTTREVRITTQRIVSISANTTYYLKAWQNGVSGGLNAKGNICAVRIK